MSRREQARSSHWEPLACYLMESNLIKGAVQAILEDKWGYRCDRDAYSDFKEEAQVVNVEVSEKLCWAMESVQGPLEIPSRCFVEVTTLSFLQDPPGSVLCVWETLRSPESPPQRSSSKPPTHQVLKNSSQTSISGKIEQANLSLFFSPNLA